MNVLFFIFQVKMSTLVLFNLNYSVHMNSVSKLSKLQWVYASPKIVYL